MTGIGIPPVPRPYPPPPDHDKMERMDARMTRIAEATLKVAQERDMLWYALEEAESVLSVFCGSEYWVGTKEGNALAKVRSVLGMIK
jgi:hypothetical protein